jgi:hypothetical protein
MVVTLDAVEVRVRMRMVVMGVAAVRVRAVRVLVRGVMLAHRRLGACGTWRGLLVARPWA